MDILYLKEVENNPKLDGFTNRPFSKLKIEELEKSFNRGEKFPKAFREFLFLAGDFNNFGFDDIDGIEALQEMLAEEIEMTGQIIERPYFAFDVLDSQYSVILLDEEDEDPTVYLLSPFLAKGGEVELLRPNGWKFSDLVNESIRRVKNNIAF